MGCLKLSYNPGGSMKIIHSGKGSTERNNRFSFRKCHINRGTASKNLLERYRFGFNGKENENEWDGQTGSKLDFGARVYDSRLGRWLACDPLANFYTSLSPYCFVGNMPIIAIDNDGKKITFGWLTTQESKDQFMSVLKKEFADKVEVMVIDGMLELQLKKGLELTTQEQKLYDKLKIVIDEEKTVEINVVQDDSNVETGSFSKAYDDSKGGYYSNTLDINDISKTKSENTSPGGDIIHEIWESYQTQALGVDEGTWEETFEKVHNEAEKIEGEICEITIIDGMSFTKDGTGYAYTNFLDKEGNKKHLEIYFEDGNVSSFSEKSGHIDLQQKTD